MCEGTPTPILTGLCPPGKALAELCTEDDWMICLLHASHVPLVFRQVRIFVGIAPPILGLVVEVLALLPAVSFLFWALLGLELGQKLGHVLTSDCAQAWTRSWSLLATVAKVRTRDKHEEGLDDVESDPLRTRNGKK